MTAENHDYSLFIDFFEAFSQAGVEGMSTEDPRRIEVEKVAERNKQIFYISDVILFDILFITKGVYSWFGIEPENVSQGYFLTTTIPEDLLRHQRARAHLVDQAQKLYAQKKGKRIISTNVRARKIDGTCVHLLYQAHLIYSEVPYESVFLVLLITDISEFTKMHKSFHFYSGDDSGFFRYPDEELLMTGNIYSHSEFNIIKLIDDGMSSKEIAEKLYRSVHTINTHRTNILKKSGKSSITDVIHDLKEMGLL